MSYPSGNIGLAAALRSSSKSTPTPKSSQMEAGDLALLQAEAKVKTTSVVEKFFSWFKN